MSGIDEIVERVRGSPRAMVMVARGLLLANGQADRALDLCDQALVLAPEDGEVRAIHAEVLSARVEDFYFKMVRDETRNAAMDRALRRALADGGRVLEIGAGTGLMTMMAARAGADEVIACERESLVAQAGRDVIALNGLENRVTIVAKDSVELAVGVDMKGPADVLLWDNVGSNLIGAGALLTIEDAKRRLVKPGGLVIPGRVAIKAALAEDLKLDRKRVGQVHGFDLSPFNRLAKPGYVIDPESERLEVRSDATTLFAFDFNCGGPFPADRAARAVTGRGGRANGVAQWLEFEFDEHEFYHTGPGARACAFAVVFRPVGETFEAAVGERFTIGAAHDRVGLWIWLEPK